MSKEQSEKKLKYKNFIYAKTLSDVFYQINANSDLTILGGCTSFAEKPFPDNNLSIMNIKELKNIEKKERYFEFGSGVPISRLIELGEHNLPATLYKAAKTIANPIVRNLATIGGNICAKDFYHTLYASLMALDAKIEFQNESESYFLPFLKFDEVPKNHILSKIRLPAENWDISIFKRLGPSSSINDLSASFVFLANSQKSQISNLRIAFAGKFKFRNIELENRLIGAHLPLSYSTIATFLLEAESIFNEVADEADAEPILKKQFWNLVNYSLEQLT